MAAIVLPHDGLSNGRDGDSEVSRSTALAGSLRAVAHMARRQTASTYNEPTVMWRMRRGEAQVALAVIAPSATGANVVWFVNGHPVGMREFSDWSSAIAWSDRIRHQNWSAGWRLAPEDE